MGLRSPKDLPGWVAQRWTIAQKIQEHRDKNEKPSPNLQYRRLCVRCTNYRFIRGGKIRKNRFICKACVEELTHEIA